MVCFGWGVCSSFALIVGVEFVVCYSVYGVVGSLVLLLFRVFDCCALLLGYVFYGRGLFACCKFLVHMFY